LKSASKTQKMERLAKLDSPGYILSKARNERCILARRRFQGK